MPFTRYTADDDKLAPYKQNRYDAGWDLRSNNEDFTLKQGAKVKVYTGITLGIPKNHVGLIVPRSGLGANSRVTLANSVGVIDSDYRGEVIVYLVNDGSTDVEIKRYDRICQIMIIPVVLQSMRKVSILADTKRGGGGFGSTGGE